VCRGEPQRTAPRIASFSNDTEATYFIFVEQKVICSVTSLTRALLIWFISHYVFNLVKFDLPEKFKNNKKECLHNK